MHFKSPLLAAFINNPVYINFTMQQIADLCEKNRELAQLLGAKA